MSGTYNLIINIENSIDILYILPLKVGPIEIVDAGVNLESPIILSSKRQFNIKKLVVTSHEKRGRPLFFRINILMG